MFSLVFSTLGLVLPPQMSAGTAVGSNVLLLDHLNINHERGRHDLVCAFYFGKA